MLKKQLIFALTGLVVVILLFKFGSTVATKSKTETPSVIAKKAFDIHLFIQEKKKHLNASQAVNLGKLENSVTRGDVNSQLIIANTQLAYFWKDSVEAFEPYVYYLSEAAKLDKSEKNLTFAAQLILHNLRSETDEAIACSVFQFNFASSGSALRLFKINWAAKVRFFSDLSNLAASDK